MLLSCELCILWALPAWRQTLSAATAAPKIAMMSCLKSPIGWRRNEGAFQMLLIRRVALTTTQKILLSQWLMGWGNALRRRTVHCGITYCFWISGYPLSSSDWRDSPCIIVGIIRTLYSYSLHWATCMYTAFTLSVCGGRSSGQINTQA